MKKSQPSARMKFYIGLIFIISIIVILSIVIPSEDLRISKGKIYPLNENWRISYEDEIIEDVSLPTMIDVDKNQEITAEVEIPDSFPDNFKIRLRSSMQEIKVLVDGEEVFKTEKPESLLFDVPESSNWYIVDLPANIQGNTLTLKMSSDVSVFSVYINPILAGDGDILIYKIILNKIPGIIISMFIFIFGVFALIISSSIRNLNDNRMLYLGALSILLSVWIFSETKMLQFVTGNRFVIGGISYIMLSLILIPFALYLREAVFIENKKALTAIVWLTFIDFIVNILLQIFGIKKFIESISYTFIIQIISATFLLVLLVREAVKLKNDKAKDFLTYFMLLIVIFSIELYNFYFGSYDYTTIYARIGILLFLILILRDSIKQLDIMMLNEKENEFMKRIAYTDILTGGNNRAAFERDFNQLLNDEELLNFRVIMMDINNLKYVNDEFGHQEGDNMIKLGYQTIVDVFNENATHYRLGGDEFTSLLKDIGEDIFEEKSEELRSRLRELSKDLKYDLHIAMGSDVYSKEIFENKVMFLNHVDNLMYENKKFLKENTQDT